MYEAIERHAQDFSDLQKIVRAPDADARVATLRRALEESAEQLNNASDGSLADRDARMRIYRGLIAASRIVDQLRDEALRG
ncbi:MAG TPA: type III secretion protein [Paraburkholderia sp.]|jgi:hypothetical protein|nr:type III secretion protein [Paraburkholderia sp.]